MNMNAASAVAEGNCFYSEVRVGGQMIALDLGDNISLSMNYVRKLFADSGKLAILIVLNIIPIVDLVILGYMAKIFRETPSSESPPKLENYGNLWVDGLKIAVALVLYMLLPLILIIVGAVSLFGGVFSRSFGMPLRLVGGGLGAIVLAAGVILAFVIAVITAMGIVHMVKAGSFGKAFAFGEIFSVIRKVGWGQYILWLIVIFVFGAVVASLGSIPIVGWIISMIVSPIFGVFSSRSAALLYVEAVTPGVSTREISGKKFCIACGAEILKEATYCPVCGKAQPQ